MSMDMYVVLHNDVLMPSLGYGVWQIPDGGEVVSAVKTALDLGYRSFDTATAYNNEQGVGQAIRESGIRREDVFLTTKIWNNDHGYDAALCAFDASINRLGLDYIDLYLIHWPVKEKFIETWKALETLYTEGRVRAIGVSNFQIHHLDALLGSCKIIPMVNQVEFHPLLTQKELLLYCQKKKIQLEAWGPLMEGRFQDEPYIEIAGKYGKTPAQVLLRWDIQHQVVTIPKSVKPQRMAENLNIFDFKLSAEEMGRLDALNKNMRFGADPDNFNF